MTSVERVWLKHPATGGFFRCPERAAEDWEKAGWVRSDPPPAPVSPVVAERIEWENQRRQSAEQQKPKTRRSAATDKGESDG